MMTEYPDLLTEDILDENIRYALEGYLYPATYSFYEENPSLDEIIKTMIYFNEYDCDRIYSGYLKKNKCRFMNY